MAAFGNAFAGPSTYVINVNPGDNPTAAYDLGTDIDVQRVPVFALTQNGPVLFYATIPVSPDGTALSSYFETNGVVGGSVYSLSDWFSSLSAENASNIVEALSVFWSDYLTSDQGATTSSFLIDALYNASSSFLAEYPERAPLYSGAGLAFQPANPDNNGEPESGTWITGTSTEKPQSMIATFDWWTHQAVEEAGYNISEALETLPTALMISTNLEAVSSSSLTNLIDMLRHIPNLSPLGDYSSSIADSNRSFTNLVDSVDFQLSNSVNSVTESGSVFASSVSNRVSGVLEDFTAITDLFTDGNRSSVLTLIPSLQYRDIAFVPLEVDCDDDRFTYHGRFVVMLRWVCLMCWYVGFVVAMWHFFRRAIRVATKILAE